VTRILPPTTDPSYQADLERFVPLDIYRANVRREEIATRLREEVTDEAIAGDVEQLHLAEIFIEGSETEDEASGEGEIMASHILYSPGDTPPDPAASPLPDDDPALVAARQEAEAAVERLSAIDDVTAREEAFAETARTESDDEGSGAEGGDLGWFPRTGIYVPELTDPLFDDADLVRADIVGPLKSAFGYHVVLFVDRRSPTNERLEEVETRLAEPDGDFAAIARELSDGDEAADGGDLGWLVRGQLPEAAQEAVLALEPEEISEPIFGDTGYHIYRLIGREARPLDATQRPLLRESAFIDWYTDEKTRAQEEGRITRDPEIFSQAAEDTIEDSIQ
jgi:parvulin-like peptidyl-prolyl isomerase